MRQRRILILTALIALAATVIAPAVADARAGSGSGSFGGSGGGFGGGGSGSGKGFIIYVAIRLLIDLIIFGHGAGAVVAVILCIGAYLYFFGGQKIVDWWNAQRRRGRAQSRKAQRRERKVELAAAEAADNDDSFDPSNVRAQAEQLFVQIQKAWSESDVVILRRLVAPRLMGEWERRLDDLANHGYTNHIDLKGDPTVAYVGIGRGAGTATNGGPDHVVVRIEAKIRDWVSDRNGREVNERGQLSKTVRMREYWTLERHDDRWRLESIEQGAEGAHQLEAQITQTEWADTQSLKDQALVEGAVAEATDADIAALTSVTFDGDAQRQALDLSLADGRFAPDLLEVAARRVTAAWAEAVDGPTGALEAVATAGAVRQMLYPAGSGSRLVIRGPKLERIVITALDAQSMPPTMTVDVKLSARRYLQDRSSGTVVAGSDTHAVTFTERWTLGLGPDEHNPWQVVAVQTPAFAR